MAVKTLAEVLRGSGSAFARSSAKVLSTVLRVGIHRDGLVEVDFRARQRNFAASGAKGDLGKKGMLL